MRRIHTAILILACLSAPAAHAQTDPQPDGIGIYADLGATQTSAFVGSIQSVEVHLLATRLSVTEGITAWETEVRIEPAGAAYLAGVTLAGGGYNISDPPHLQVGYAPGVLPAEGPIVALATLEILLVSLDPVELHLVDTEQGGPYYALEPDGRPVPLHRSTGGEGTAVFRFNGPGPVPAEAPSWGRLKALYR
jgi:hypothetical protein